MDQWANAHHGVVLARKAKRAGTLGGAASDADNGIDHQRAHRGRGEEKNIMTTTVQEHPADTRRRC